MADNKQEIEPQKQVLTTNSRKSFSAILIYAFGFYVTQKSDYDNTTGLGIAMLIFGWFCMLLSLVLSVLIIFNMFKEHSNKK